MSPRLFKELRFEYGSVRSVGRLYLVTDYFCPALVQFHIAFLLRRASSRSTSLLFTKSIKLSNMVKKVVDKVKAGYVWMGVKAKTCKAFVAANSAIQGVKNGSAWVAVKGKKFKRFVERQMEDPDQVIQGGALGQLEVTLSGQELALKCVVSQKKLAAETAQQNNLELVMNEMRVKHLHGDGTEITDPILIQDLYRLREEILLRAAVRAGQLDATFEMVEKAKEHIPKSILDARNLATSSAGFEKLIEDDLTALFQQQG
ncbi:PREDICTED: uncharacterized protein LOC104745168 isoform X1 [Camelina sativa]|uniref:Uncharacterized protein LOC104745168 isoform X1 n=1 Tax=Camelina sativa TaxID=90675 RepID=A0ABM0W2B2_CAMSA|nr:PREDICTED: uncharacterized protein LOC104745168 isoform X1 [Camelina sativa]